MNRELLSKALGEISESYIAEAYRPLPEDASSASERIVHMKKKRMITAALAAALAFVLGITAYAAWSIHAERQQELRDKLQIDENNVSSYVEYDVASSEPADGLTLLSAVNNGQQELVYVNIAPVSAEEAASSFLDFTWSVEGTEITGSASPEFSAESSSVYYGTDASALTQRAYDPETQTLTLVCFLDVNSINQAMEELGTESIPLTVHMFTGDLYEGSVASRSFGPATFALTEEEFRYFDFGGALYHDPELDRDIELVGLELTPFSAEWLVRFEGDEAVEAEKYDGFEAYRSWFELENKMCQEMKLIFSDGSERFIGGALYSFYEDGAVHLWYSWKNSAIDIGAVRRIVLGDLILWEAE